MQKRRRSGVKKLEANADLPLYCICRSSDGERFMIACDQCEEWFHGDCIGVTPKQAEQIKTYFCPQCRRNESSLQIEYKSNRGIRNKPSRSSPGSSNSVHADPPLTTKTISKRNSGGIPVAPNQVTGKLKQERTSPPQTNNERKYTPPDPKVSPTSILDGYGDCTGPTSPIGYISRNFWPRDSDHIQFDDEPVTHIPPTSRTRSSAPRVRSCGNCHGCTRTEDCGKCDYCRDRRKFGGPNRMRQKCRLRQCIDSGNPRMRTSYAAHGVGSRRRKQQTLTGVLLGPSSPSNTHQYADFDDEPFEVPTDFSPRPFVDHNTPSVYSQHVANQSLNIGSKMRRGDHRMTSATHDLDTMDSRSFQRIPFDAAGDAMNLLHDDSDEDVMIPGPPHCAGPTCVSAPIPGDLYCSESCRMKHTNSRSGPRAAPSRAGLRYQPVIPYNLPYPDHMYCRHHRVYNWHGNGSISSSGPPSYRTSMSQSFEPHFSPDGPLDLPIRSHNSYLPYANTPASGQMHHHHQQQQQNPHHPHLVQRIPVSHNHHPINPNERLAALGADGGLCGSSADTTAFLDSVESAMRKAVVPPVGDEEEEEDDLTIGLPHSHSQPTGPHISPSTGLGGPNHFYGGRGNTAADLHRLVDFVNTQSDGCGLSPGNGVDDGEEDVDGGQQQPVSGSVGDEDDAVGVVNGVHDPHGASGNHYYYMMAYPPDHSTNGGHPSSRSIDDTRGLGNRRIERGRHLNNRLLLPNNSNTNTSNGLGSPYGSMRSGSAMRHSSGLNVSTSALQQDCGVGGDIVPVNSVQSASLQNSVPSHHSIGAYLPGPDEFYTITDSDDLEINWPQETVAGVND